MIANSKKLRQTDARRVILEEIKKVHTHPTADEVYEMVRKRIPRISLGTIYRNLEILSGEGHIHKLEIGGTQKRFDGNTGNHYHLRCVECGRVIDLTTDPLKNIEKTLSKLTDYEIIGYRLELIGVCLSCKPVKQKESPSKVKMERVKRAVPLNLLRD